MEFMTRYSVKAIANKETYDLLLNVHYAKRIPSISYSFGLFLDNTLVGVVTYGTPVSSSLRTGIAGKDLAPIVLELNRLCLRDNKHNEASYLVGKSLKLLPSPSIIVSYADTSKGHLGIVYQACNFMYSGLSAKRSDYKIKGMEHLHGATISDMSRGKPNRIQWLKDTFGDDFYLEQRPRKHRYIYIVANKYKKKEIMNSIKYPIVPYPKIEIIIDNKCE